MLGTILSSYFKKSSQYSTILHLDNCKEYALGFKRYEWLWRKHRTLLGFYVVIVILQNVKNVWCPRIMSNWEKPGGCAFVPGVS